MAFYTTVGCWTRWSVRGWWTCHWPLEQRFCTAILEALQHKSTLQALPVSDSATSALTTMARGVANMLGLRKPTFAGQNNVRTNMLFIPNVIRYRMHSQSLFHSSWITSCCRPTSRSTVMNKLQTKPCACRVRDHKHPRLANDDIGACQVSFRL